MQNDVEVLGTPKRQALLVHADLGSGSANKCVLTLETLEPCLKD